jgi:tetratricopeptide (TPR) repeat protein
MLSNTEANLSASYEKLDDWEKAAYYQKQAIMHAKQTEDGEDDNKIRKVYGYLNGLVRLHQTMGQSDERKVIGEEAYICVYEVYDPKHPLVLEAGGKLIEILSHTGDYYDAERFARICYEALKRPPLDPNSFEAATAARNLARASCDLIKENGAESADIDEAEMLARYAVRITKDLKGASSIEMVSIFNALVTVQFTKNDLTDKTKTLLKDYLCETMIHPGMSDKQSDHANLHLGRFHHKTAHASSCNCQRESIFDFLNHTIKKRYDCL